MEKESDEHGVHVTRELCSTENIISHLVCHWLREFRSQFPNAGVESKVSVSKDWTVLLLSANKNATL